MPHKAVDFLLVGQYWSGPKIIREGPEIIRFFVDKNVEGGVFQYILENNPIKDDEVIAGFAPMHEKINFKTLGDVDENKDYLKPGTTWNETKKTPSWIKILDRGKALFLIDGKNFKKILLNGKNLKGLYFITAKNKMDNFWIFKKAGTSKKNGLIK